MQLQIGEVSRPYQSGNVLCKTKLDVIVAAVAPDRRGLHPVRTMLWAALLVEEHSVHAFRIAFECKRAAVEMRQQHRRNADEVVDHLPLSESHRRIQNFIEVGQFELLTFDLDYRVFLGHERSLTLGCSGTANTKVTKERTRGHGAL